MQLIKDNMVILVVAGVAILLSIIFLAVGAGAGSDVDATYKSRKDTIRKISDQEKLVDKEKVNEKTVKEIQGYVEKIKLQAAECAAKCTEWNSRYFVKDILAISHQSVGVMPAFPTDRKKMDSERLWMPFIKSYLDAHKVLEDKLKTMSPQLPVDTDVEKEAAYWQEVLTRNKLQTKQDASPNEIPTIIPSEEVEIKAQARSVAFGIVKKRKAQTGVMYVDDNILEKVFSATSSEAIDQEKMVQAQVSLWMQKDILEAIFDINKEELDKYVKKFEAHNASVANIADRLSPCVVQSPIKRLISLKVIDVVRQPDALPGYNVGKLGITIPFELKLVMPLRYVPLLVNRLGAKNYYKICNMKATTTVVPPDAKYTYGLDPVMDVTLDGELLLLSSWQATLLAPVPEAAPPPAAPSPAAPAAPAPKAKKK